MHSDSFDVPLVANSVRKGRKSTNSDNSCKSIGGRSGNAMPDGASGPFPPFISMFGNLSSGMVGREILGSDDICSRAASMPSCCSAMASSSASCPVFSSASAFLSSYCAYASIILLTGRCREGEGEGGGRRKRKNKTDQVKNWCEETRGTKST